MKPLARNFAATTIADAGSRVLGFLVTACLARRLGPSSFGILSIGISLLGYAVLLAGPGLSVFATRRIAATDGSERSFARSVMGLRAVLAAFWTVVALLGSLVVYGPAHSWLVVAAFLLGTIPMAWGPDWYLQGKNSMGWIAVARLGMYATYLVLVLALVREPSDAVWAGIAFTLSNTVMAIVLFVGYRSLAGGTGNAGDPKTPWSDLLKASFPLGVSALLAQTVVNLPVLLVGAIVSNFEAGLLGSAMKLVFFVLMVDRVFYVLFLPVASRAFAHGKEYLETVGIIAARVVLAVMIPVSILGMFYAGWAITIVYAQGFEQAGNVLLYSMPYALLTVVSTAMMTMLYAAGRESDVMKALTGGVITIVILCSTFAALWGAQGSAAALSLGEAVMAVLLAMNLKRVLRFPIEIICVRFLAAGVMMILSLYFVVGLHPVLGGTIGLVVFLLGAMASGGLTMSDFRILREKMA